MNPLYGKALLFLGLLLTIVIRIPHDKRSSATKVLKDCKTLLEKALLGGVAVGVMILPLLAIFTPALSIADYDLSISFLLSARFF
jgi:hypothetical protein